jgi:hypothetical protein
METIYIEEKGQKLENLEKECMELVCTLINKTSFGSGYDTYERHHNERLDEIINVAVEKTLEMKRKLHEERKVFPGDFVVVLVDDEKYIRYLLVRDGKSYNWVIPTGTRTKEENFINLRVHDGLGYELVGRKVGDSFTYGEDNGKLYHTYKILSCRKTELSEDIGKEELLADIEMRKSK